MKKRGIITLIVVALAVAVLAGSAVFLTRNSRQLQAQCHAQYEMMQETVTALKVTVTEGGKEIGVYDLKQLGILEEALASVDESYMEQERMSKPEFSELSAVDVLKWRFGRQELPQTVSVAVQQPDVTDLAEALNELPRQASQDAYVQYEDGAFSVVEEMPGTEIDENGLKEALKSVLQTAEVTADTRQIPLELTEHSCYLLPQKTVKNTVFDYAEELETVLTGLQITVDFQGQKESLSAAQLQQLLSVDPEGKVSVDEVLLSQIVAEWHETYRNDGVPYLFSAQVGGIKPIDFLIVDYEIDQEGTEEKLAQVLLQLQSTETEPVWYCWYKDENFALEEEYVEVDIPNQKMTYVKDGEVLVSTDVVTGASWGFPTPPGLYKVENKDTGCWLEGEDYRVFVDYWIGFVGYEYGIHDADWRTKFGGTNYVKNGSHGCVNTPKEATALIFDNIEVGVPVLVYGK